MTANATLSPHSLSSCPGCGSSALGETLFLASQPVILNYRFPTEAAAKDVVRRDMELRECNACGLVFNAILDADVIPYDERYENRQNFSTAFLAMLEETAQQLTDRYSLTGGAVLEVGCGKGDFLTLLCEKAQARGLGYDTSCEETGTSADGRVSFFQQYVGPEDVKGKIDIVICRHVVEHVPQIGDFFQLLYDIAVAGGGSTVYVETPALEWIVDHHAFWDVFYEHCNYFPMRTLRFLAERVGFEVLDHRLIFGSQYQALELRPSKNGKPSASTPEPSAGILRKFNDSLASSRREVAANLGEAGVDGGWAIWGAGAKGVSLATTLVSPPPRFVIDSNPAKQGMFLPGTGVRVVAPSDPRVAAVPLILVANGNYLSEIQATLAQQGLTPRLLPL